MAQPTESHVGEDNDRGLMTAAVARQYGSPDVVEIGKVARPEPGDGQVLIRVRAASVNALDWHMLTGTPYVARLSAGLVRPKQIIGGADVSGTVSATGPGASGLELGDEVFGVTENGGFAEYVLAEAESMVPAPSTLPLEEAATLGVAGLTAVQGLRDWGRIQPGDRVLINGASGGVGTFAIQIARALGAGDVTAVCSTHNVETARRLGADRVVDYTTEDLAPLDDRFDVFFDNAGSLTLGQSRRLLKPDGRLVMITGRKGRWLAPVPRLIGGMVRSLFWSQSFASGVSQSSRDDLLLLREWVETGRIRPVLDRRYTLTQVPEALRYQGAFHARGKSIVVIDDTGSRST